MEQGFATPSPQSFPRFGLEVSKPVFQFARILDRIEHFFPVHGFGLAKLF